MESTPAVPAAPAPVPPVPPVEAAKPDHSWAMFCHLAALSGGVVPFGNFVGPLVVWQIKKAEIPGLQAHAYEALNFQISLFIYLVVSSLLCLIGIPLVFVLALAGILFPILAGLKANDGGFYKYPMTIRFLK